MTKTIRHTGNPYIYGIMILGVVGLSFYSGYQTWGCVNWLYPSDQDQMKFITVFSFDGCAFLWAVAHLFYVCASRSTKNIINAALSIDFVLSASATVLYIMVSNVFRYHGVVPVSYVQCAETLSVIALMGNILFLSFFVSIEWKLRHPDEDTYLDEKSMQMSNSFSQIGTLNEKELDIIFTKWEQEKKNGRKGTREKQYEPTT